MLLHIAPTAAVMPCLLPDLIRILQGQETSADRLSTIIADHGKKSRISLSLSCIEPQVQTTATRTEVCHKPAAWRAQAVSCCENRCEKVIRNRRGVKICPVGREVSAPSRGATYSWAGGAFCEEPATPSPSIRLHRGLSVFPPVSHNRAQDDRCGIFRCGLRLRDRQ